MHERKATMASLADGFVALPGGLGTLEETLEMLTWSQLGIHRKPVGLVNVAGYWDPLLSLLAHAAREGFIRPEHLALFVVADTPSDLLDRLATWNPPSLPRALALFRAVVTRARWAGDRVGGPATTSVAALGAVDVTIRPAAPACVGSDTGRRTPPPTPPPSAPRCVHEKEEARAKRACPGASEALVQRGGAG